MGSWAQSKLPLLMLPGKWWHELCQWKPSSEAGRHSPSCAGGWGGSYCVGRFLSTITTFYWRNTSSTQIWNISWWQRLLFRFYIQTWIVKTESWYSCFSCLFPHLLKGKKNRIYYRDKERTLIAFFTRDILVDTSFVNLSNTLHLV